MLGIEAISVFKRGLDNLYVPMKVKGVLAVKSVSGSEVVGSRPTLQTPQQIYDNDRISDEGGRI